MPLGRTAITASIMALLLMAAVPVDAAPSLQKGASSTYNFSAVTNVIQNCVQSQTSPLVCPLIAVCNPVIESCGMSTDVNGTIGWNVADLTSTTASLNVTHDLTVSSGDPTRSVIHSSNSFKESIDLATRLVSLFPATVPEMDQFSQMTQAMAAANLAGLNLTALMPILDGMIPHSPFYTMWWVNGPLKLNQTIPVLVFPTNVTGTTNVDLGGSLGTREAWKLMFNFSRPTFDPVLATNTNPLIVDSLRVGLVFNYDKTSDLLLSATVDIHTGLSEISIPSSTCTPSATMRCPINSSSTTIIRNFGINFEATMKLSGTAVDLSSRMTQTPSQDSGGTQSSGGSSNGSGTGANNGSGSNTGTNGGGSTSASNNGAIGSTGRPSANSNQPSQASNLPTWIYGLLGVLAVAVIGSAAWIARRRSKTRAVSTSAKTLE